MLNCRLCCSLLSPLSLRLLRKPEMICSLEACSRSRSPLFLTRSLLRSDFFGPSENSLSLHLVPLAMLWHVYLCLPLSACLAPYCGPVAMWWGWEWQGSVWPADVRREVKDVKRATSHGDTALMGLTWPLGNSLSALQAARSGLGVSLVFSGTLRVFQCAEFTNLT